jgi:hypothetical protein
MLTGGMGGQAVEFFEQVGIQPVNVELLDGGFSAWSFVAQQGA